MIIIEENENTNKKNSQRHKKLGILQVIINHGNFEPSQIIFHKMDSSD